VDVTPHGSVMFGPVTSANLPVNTRSKMPRLIR
jgi:hypothetical protein